MEQFHFQLHIHFFSSTPIQWTQHLLLSSKTCIDSHRLQASLQQTASKLTRNLHTWRKGEGFQVAYDMNVRYNTYILAVWSQWQGTSRAFTGRKLWPAWWCSLKWCPLPKIHWQFLIHINWITNCIMHKLEQIESKWDCIMQRWTQIMVSSRHIKQKG